MSGFGELLGVIFKHLPEEAQRYFLSLSGKQIRDGMDRQAHGIKGRDERNAQPGGKDERQAELRKLLERNPRATPKQLHMDLVELGYEVTERTVRNDLASLRL